MDDGHVYGLVAFDGQCRFFAHHVPQEVWASLDNAVAMRLFSSLTDSKADRIGDNLAKLIPEDIRKELHGKQEYVISPHGKLWEYPWRLMRLSPESEPIGRHASVSTIDTVGRWMKARSYRARERKRKAYLGGIADFERPRPEGTARRRGTVRAGEVLYDLPAVREELEAAATEYGVRPEIDTAFDRDGFLSGSADVDLVVVADHCVVDPGRAELMGFAIHPLKDERQRFFRAREFPRGGMRASLFVLSSCLSASGDALDGTGLVGLTSFLLQSGVACSIGALWEVDDVETGRLMAAFHRIWSKGDCGAGEALARASHEPGVSVDTWAAFTVYGDAEVRWTGPREAA